MLHKQYYPKKEGQHPMGMTHLTAVGSVQILCNESKSQSAAQKHKHKHRHDSCVSSPDPIFDDEAFLRALPLGLALWGKI